MLKALAVIVVLVAALCGYYLFKAGGDVTLAKAVMSYELTEFFGSFGSKDSTSEDYAKLAADSSAEPAPSGDAMYRDGNRFSDYKKQGTDEQVDIRANP